MDSILSKTLQRFANDQARAYIDKKDVVLDTPSADNLYKICRDFMSFLDDSGNKTISDKLHTIDEDSRVEEVVKLLRVQINNSKRRKYSMASFRGRLAKCSSLLVFQKSKVRVVVLPYLHQLKVIRIRRI